jgi:hypothetical protein
MPARCRLAGAAPGCPDELDADDAERGAVMSAPLSRCRTVAYQVTGTGHVRSRRMDRPPFSITTRAG